MQHQPPEDTPRLGPRHTPTGPTPAKIGRFPVTGHLGSGGMGIVYEAHDPKLDRTVALKILLPDQLQQPEARERLLREARAAAALNHPHIATVYELGRSEDIHWIAMEFIDGSVLRKRISRAQLSIHQALSWGMQICDALAEAHERGIVHRDIKSTNVMVTTRNDIKVLDFGLALVERWYESEQDEAGDTRLTQSGAIVGTVDYLAPEVLRGDDSSPRSDVFALGALLYEMLCGRTPFSGRTAVLVMNAILSNEPKALSVHRDDLPQGLETVVQRALSKEADKRHASARELLEELRTVYEAWRSPDARSAQALSSVTGDIPNNLPVSVSRFVGRDEERRELLDLLDGNRLLTITGPGGAGKTSLCLEVARAALQRFPGGAFFVDLAPRTELGHVAPAVAGVLEIREESARDLVETIVEHLQKRRVLLVLDNCEHLIGPSASLAARLLQSCAELHVMATSQERLDVPGERVWQIPSLSLPDAADSSLEDVLKSSAVQLFSERATAVRSSFVLTERNAPSVVQICRRLDAIPLAIELAAARVRILSVEQILERLEDRFRLLTGGSRGVMPRQQTLRGAVEWSIDLLSDDERTVLRRISVFADGFTLEAAEAVCCGDGIEQYDVLDYLTRLVDKSLLRAGGDDEQRYQQLQTLREFAFDLLRETDDESDVRSRHAAYLLDWALRASQRLTGAEQAMWLERLSRDSGNLSHAIRWLTKTAPHDALRLAASIWRYWHVRGRLSEGRQLLARVLAAPESVDSDGGIARAEALHGAGALAHDQGDYDAARQSFAACLTIRRRLSDRAGVAQTLNSLGIAARDQGDYATARSLLEEGLSIHRFIDDQPGVAMSIHALGITAHNEGHCSAAWALFEEGLAIRRRLQDRRGIAALLAHLGSVAYDQREYAEAQRLLEDALRMFRELGNKRGILWALMHLGAVSQQRNDLVTARSQHRGSLRLSHELGDRHHIARSLEWMASLAIANKQKEQALRLFGSAAALRRSIGSPLTPIERCNVESETQRARKNIDAARANQLLDEGGNWDVPTAVAMALES